MIYTLGRFGRRKFHLQVKYLVHLFFPAFAFLRATICGCLGATALSFYKRIIPNHFLITSEIVGLHSHAIIVMSRIRIVRIIFFRQRFLEMNQKPKFCKQIFFLNNEIQNSKDVIFFEFKEVGLPMNFLILLKFTIVTSKFLLFKCVRGNRSFFLKTSAV